MSTPTDPQKDFASLKKVSLLVGIGWTLLCLFSVYLNVSTEKKRTLELAHKEAITVLNKDQAFRFWATRHGGVYVPVTEATPPNPNLSHLPDRDITTSSGHHLTLMNPAYIMRQVMGQYDNQFKIKGHITSLRTLNPMNEPDEWESRALKQFEDGATEIFEIESHGDNHFMRLIRPVYAQKDCLKCHANQGYKEGDVRGGLSVSIPLSSYYALEKQSLMKIYFTHSFFWLAGFFLLASTYQRGKTRLDERLEAAQALHDSSEKIKVFAYSVAHDLKNPVISIHGLTKLLDRKYRDVLDEKGRRFCTQIIKSAEQLTTLVEQINVYISTKEFPIDLKDLDPTVIFRLIKQEYKSQLQARNITWREPERLPTIKADKVSLLRVFRNLVDNALKYGGASLSTIEIGYDESPGYYIFSVKNDGAALCPTDCRKIFAQFKRKDSNSDVEGTGLGLDIVKEIVGLHDGKVWGESDGKKGITFFFTLSK